MQNASTSPSPVIIKVTDSCQCSYNGVTNLPCCSNVTHFNIDYDAFEQLAHPDYGYMNMKFRSAVNTSGTLAGGMLMQGVMCHLL